MCARTHADACARACARNARNDAFKQRPVARLRARDAHFAREPRLLLVRHVAVVHAQLVFSVLGCSAVSDMSCVCGSNKAAARARAYAQHKGRGGALARGPRTTACDDSDDHTQSVTKL